MNHFYFSTTKIICPTGSINKLLLDMAFHNSVLKYKLILKIQSSVVILTECKPVFQRSIYGLYIKSAPFFSDLKNLLETKNNSRFYILKLFFLLHCNRFSCPVTSLVNISLQSWCILFKIRKNRHFWPNKCFILLS